MRTVKCTGRLAVTLPGVLLLVFLTIAQAAVAEEPLSRYDVVWDSPSKDASGSMPLGNGEIGLSAWVEPAGDVVFYISKTDAWGDNGRLLKVGRARIKLDPAPSMRPFRQTLRLREGMIEVVCGEREDATTIGLWVDARNYLVGRAKNRHTGSRFPAFWGPNYDWIPDQDHGGILSKALQAMLLQTEGRKIFLLPAWPKDWNVHFKLHAPYRTTVRCEYRDGRIQELSVSPRERRADVILPEAQ